MLARCPHCNTIFRISVQQLRIAHGFARCGVCLTPFNAIEHLEDIEDLEDTLSRSAEFKLFDIPAKPATSPPADKTATVTPATPEVAPADTVLPAASKLAGSESVHTVGDTVSSAVAASVIVEPVPAPAPSPAMAMPLPLTAADEFPTVPIIPTDKTQKLDTKFPPPAGIQPTVKIPEPPAVSVPESGLAPVSMAPTVGDNFPPLPPGFPEPEFHDMEFATVEFQLPSFSPRENEPIATAIPEQARSAENREKLGRNALPIRRSGHNLLWGVGSVFLLLTLITLVAWLHGAELLERLPVLRPPVQFVCQTLGCEVPIRRQVDAIRLVSRDVRAHPGFRQALLVNAVFVNEAGFRQPYPVLQLELFDTSGNMLAARRFEPTEYLDKGIKIAEGMPSGIPVNIMLELAEPRQFPESFQFHFL